MAEALSPSLQLPALHSRVKVLWRSGQWYAGTVVKHAGTRKFKVVYDDGDRKWHTTGSKVKCWDASPVELKVARLFHNAAAASKKSRAQALQCTLYEQLKSAGDPVQLMTAALTRSDPGLPSHARVGTILPGDDGSEDDEMERSLDMDLLPGQLSLPGGMSPSFDSDTPVTPGILSPAMVAATAQALSALPESKAQFDDEDTAASQSSTASSDSASCSSASDDGDATSSTEDSECTSSDDDSDDEDDSEEDSSEAPTSDEDSDVDATCSSAPKRARPARRSTVTGNEEAPTAMYVKWVWQPSLGSTSEVARTTADIAATWDAVLSAARTQLGISADCPLCAYWIDSDGDQVQLRSDVDWQQAVDWYQAQRTAMHHKRRASRRMLKHTLARGDLLSTLGSTGSSQPQAELLSTLQAAALVPAQLCLRVHIAPAQPASVKSPASITARLRGSLRSTVGPAGAPAVGPEEPDRRWQKGKILGTGSFGKVFAGLDVATGKPMAVKVLHADAGEAATLALQREMTFLQSLDHPNVIQYYGSGRYHNKLCLFMELATGGSLWDAVQQFGPLAEHVAARYVRDMVAGLAYLHEQHIIVRDVKPSNACLQDGVVKLLDFGTARILQPGVDSHAHTAIGTHLYAAPEILAGNPSYDSAVDIFSLGMTVVTLFTGTHPWGGNAAHAVYRVCFSSDSPALPDSLSVPARSFIEECLKREPAERPTAAELLAHPFLAHPPGPEEGFQGCAPRDVDESGDTWFTPSPTSPAHSLASTVRTSTSLFSR